MRIKFNYYERIAGIFVITAILGALASSVGVAIKRGWLESKVSLRTNLESADGLRIGTQVQVAGLKAGSVTDIELKSDNSILVHFEVKSRFFDRIKKDSYVQVTRPFIIGEKILDVSVGSDESRQVAKLELIPSKQTLDIMDLMSGKRLGPLLSNFTKLLENMKFIADAFVDKKRGKDFIEIYDQLKPTLKNVNQMSTQLTTLTRNMNKNLKLIKTLDNISLTSSEVNKILPAFSEQAPELGKDVTQLTKNLAAITQELQVFLPMVREMAPEVPAVSNRAIEALNETVVLLKALQKTWVLKSASEEVREEEDKRKPASKDKED